jgi:pantoate--beta-alanine ligase
MHTFVDVQSLRAQIARWRAQGESLAFVPTMGNLHEGHLQLVRRARQVADRVVVSIFVNPMQFAPGEDYDTYPRTLDTDSRLLTAERTDVLFAPDVSVIYPGGAEATTRIEVPGPGQGLEDEFRPGFFIGVATVVARLFNIIQPDYALFGEKDYQQLVVIRVMVADLCWPIEIIGVPMMREPDGLAMSSRNQYLTGEERQRAPLLHQTLTRLAEQIAAGNPYFEMLEEEAMKSLADGGFDPDYVCIRHADSLLPVVPGEPRCVVLAAARLGKARLIDNIILQTQGPD